jgi:hypothetical protein
MKTRHFFDELRSCLSLPPEIIEDVIREIKSHCSSLTKEERKHISWGDPRTLAVAINGTKNITFFDMLRLKSTIKISAKLFLNTLFTLWISFWVTFGLTFIFYWIEGFIYNSIYSLNSNLADSLVWNLLEAMRWLIVILVGVGIYLYGSNRILKDIKYPPQAAVGIIASLFPLLLIIGVYYLINMFSFGISFMASPLVFSLFTSPIIMSWIIYYLSKKIKRHEIS